MGGTGPGVSIGSVRRRHAAPTRRSVDSTTRSSAPDLRAQQKWYTRQRLIAAAAGLFASKGYEATTVDDIVAEAGVARATFYLHFAGKNDIVVELADRIWADTAAMFAAFGELPDWSHASIRAWLHTYVTRGEENRQALNFFAEQLPHALRGQHQEHVKEFVALLTRPPERWAVGGDRPVVAGGVPAREGAVPA
ncbi:TetR family transcriptional regulator [Streptomyces sp. SID3343]|nr:TetR family transcriptional regulator [Streptomyces sp. SID3343]